MVNSQDSNKSSRNTENSISSTAGADNAKDYISGDSTPSSSGHQFPWIATNPKKESKKSAMKTNNT